MLTRKTSVGETTMPDTSRGQNYQTTKAAIGGNDLVIIRHKLV